MTESTHSSNPVEYLADEFVRRTRQGERPSLAEYCERFPQYAEEIRRLFPTAMLLERMKPAAHELQGSSFRQTAAPAPDAPARLGDYLILREVGRGGMGVVYEAEQQSLGRRVALKILSGMNSQDAKHVARFEREARSAARLHHTNIVPVFGVGEHEGRHYLVMQLIPGQGLDHVLDELRRLQAGGFPPVVETAAGARPPEPASSLSIAQGLLTGSFAAPSRPATERDDLGLPAQPGQATSTPRLPKPPTPANDSTAVARARTAQTTWQSARSSAENAYWRSVSRIGIDVARALEYSHSQGVLHRDIKPSNLLLDVHGAAWVVDFGLAKSDDSGDLTLSGEFVGTLRYMAPERLQGQCDVRADVYSLGLTLYELLTLTPAFDASEKGQLINQVMQAEPKPPRQINASIPADLETIVGKAISRDPNHRYQSPGELGDDLSRFLDDLPIAARPASATERLWRWCRRNPKVAVPITLCGLLLVAYAVTATVLNVRLDVARHDAEIARGVADRRRIDAENNRRDAVQRGAEALASAAQALASAEESRNHLVRLNVAQGASLLEKGDSLEALPFFAEALRLDQGEPERERSHRLRLKAIVRYAPRLVKVCQATSDSEADQISPDGKLFASGPVNMFRKGSVLGPLFAADKRILVGPQSIQVRAIPSCGTVCRLEHAAVVVDCDFSPDSRSLATACVDGTIRIWDVRTGEPRSTMSAAHPGVRALAFVPGGDACVSAGLDDIVRFWDPGTGTLQRSVNLPVTQHAIEIHSGGYLSQVDHDPMFFFWNPMFGDLLDSPLRHATATGTSRVTPDKRYALTRTRDRSLRLWDLSCAAVSAPAIPDTLWSWKKYRRHSPDGRYALGVLAYRNTVRDTRTGEVVLTVGDSASTSLAEFSEDGRFVLAIQRDGSARLWNATSVHLTDPQATQVKPTPGSPASEIMRFPSGIITARVNSDGSRVITLSEDGIVRTWNPAAPERPVSEFFIGISPVELYISPNGNYAVTDRQVVTWGTQDTGCLWDLRDGHPVAEIQLRWHWTRYVSCIFSPDGNSWLSSSSGELIVRETATGRVIARCGQWPDVVTVAAFVGSSRAVTGSDDGTLRLWDLATASLIREIDGHHAKIYWLDVSPDGRHIVSTSADQTARIWDVATGELVALFRHSQALHQAYYAPDGKTLIILDDLGAVRHFHLDIDNRPVADWIAIAELLGGKLAVAGVDQPQSRSAYGSAAWERLHAAYPDEFSAAVDDELNWSRRSPAK